MANFLKLEDSYLGNDVLKNPDFDRLGPNVINSNFSEIADGTDVSVLSGWSIFQGATATIEGGKLKVVSDGTSSSASARYVMSDLTVGKVYEFSCKAEGDLTDVGIAFSGYTDVSTLGGNVVFTFKALSTGSSIFFTARNNGNPGTVEYSEISLKESGIVEFVDNPYFKGVSHGTDVTTLPGWYTYTVGGTPTSKNVDLVGNKNKLVIVSTGPNQGAKYDLTNIPEGTEINIKIESVTGSIGDGALFVDGLSPQSLGNIPTSSGSVDFTFVTQSGTNALYFRAGDNAAGTTEYYNISVQPTNVFAYAVERNLTNTNANDKGVIFTNNTMTFLPAETSGLPIYTFLKLNTNTAISGYERFKLEVDVSSLKGHFFFSVLTSSGSVYEFIDLKEGLNEVYMYRSAPGDNYNVYIRVSTDEVDSSLIIDSIKYSAEFQKPNLIGVTNVSTVSAPTNDSVVINNGLVDGADVVTIYYDEDEASSTVEMRNYFQDKIIEASNSNNTKRVIDLKPPVLIKSIQVS